MKKKNWEGKDKVYVLKIDIDGIGYYIYRSAELFKFFSEDKEVLFTSLSSRELSEKLKSYTNFAVQLPNRSEKIRSDTSCIQLFTILYRSRSLRRK